MIWTAGMAYRATAALTGVGISLSTQRPEAETRRIHSSRQRYTCGERVPPQCWRVPDTWSSK